MIAEAELRRRAARWRVDPMVADLDYSLGWFLAAITGVSSAITSMSGVPFERFLSEGHEQGLSPYQGLSQILGATHLEPALGLGITLASTGFGALRCSSEVRCTWFA